MVRLGGHYRNEAAVSALKEIITTLPRAGALTLMAAAAACGGGKPAGPAAFPPMPVEAITLAERPVEQTTEFVATVRSRRSTIVQPQVEGFVTRIQARAGDRVRAGAPIMQ